MKGYALIEIIIVVAIIVLFSALSLGYYRNFDEQKKLDGEVKQFVDVLNLAASKSNAGDLSPNPICTDFQGYGIGIDTADSYSLKFNCGGIYSTIQTYTLKAGITLSEVGTNILFKPLTEGTNLVDQAPITFTSNVTGKCMKVLVNPVGTVEEASSCAPVTPTLTPIPTQIPTLTPTTTPVPPTSTPTPTPTIAYWNPGVPIPPDNPWTPFSNFGGFTFNTYIYQGVGLVTSSPTGIACYSGWPSGGSEGKCLNYFQKYSYITLYATPGPGWRFSHWGGDPGQQWYSDCAGSSTTLTMYLSESKSCYAFFTQ